MANVLVIIGRPKYEFGRRSDNGELQIYRNDENCLQNCDAPPVYEKPKVSE